MAQLNHPYFIEPRRAPDSHLELDGLWDYSGLDEAVDDPTLIDWSWQTQVPNSIYWSLYESGVLPHPYHGCNSKQYHWVDEKVWYYRKIFPVSREQAGKQAFLCFDGIAYFARIWLNGQLLGEHEGMFGGPVVEVGRWLLSGQNNELIVEAKACNFGRKSSWDPWNRAGDNREIVPWNLSRDNRTSNGDFIVIGLWRGVRIEFLAPCHISRPYLTTRSISDDAAQLHLQLQIADGSIDELAIRQDYAGGMYGYTRAFDQGLTGAVKPDPYVVLQVKVLEKTSGRSVFSHEETIDLLDHAASGITTEFAELQFYQLPFSITTPRLWFPNGLGEPFLYTIELSLYQNQDLCDRQQFDFGIRTLKLVPSAGQQYRVRWDTFQFVVNDQPFFLKGMNWMPLDYLLRLPADRYRWALELARDAGIQLLRVWSGGGIPESDDFYQLCDQYGLMVWQDSFIANMETPNWPQDILQAQVCLNLYRTRNHPSLAVHCGGNEFNPYAFGNAASMFVIERNIADLDPVRPFFRTTADRGSAHIYRDMEPTWYRHQYRQLPFLAESGIHSFPNYKSLRQLLSREELEKPLADLFDAQFSLENPELRNHFTEYVPERVPRMLARASHISKIKGISLPDLVEATQIASYEFYQIMIQAMRTNYPVTCGIMPWVFKRAWTTVGIQLVDGLGDPIAPFYAVKNAYRPQIVVVGFDHMSVAPGETIRLPVTLIDEGPGDYNGVTVSLMIMDPEMRPVDQYEWPVQIGASKQTSWQDITMSVPEKYADRFFFVMALLKKDGEVLARSFYWPRCLACLAEEPFRTQYRSRPNPNLSHDNGPWLKQQLQAAPQADLSVAVASITESEDRMHMVLLLENRSETPAFPVRIDIDEDKTLSYAEDNYFCLMPGETRRIAVTTDTTGYDAATLTLTMTAWNSRPVVCSIDRPGARSKP